MPRRKVSKDARTRRPRTRKPPHLCAVVLHGVRLPRYKLDVLRRHGNVRKQIEAALDANAAIKAAFDAERRRLDAITS